MMLSAVLCLDMRRGVDRGEKLVTFHRQILLEQRAGAPILQGLAPVGRLLERLHAVEPIDQLLHGADCSRLRDGLLVRSAVFTCFDRRE